MRVFLKIAALFGFALTACESFGADDVATGLACGTRETACRDQCRQSFDVVGDAQSYVDCLDQCSPSQETVCR